MSDQFTGVKPVESAIARAGRLEDFLKKHLEGFARAAPGSSTFKGGQSNPTYRITAGGKR